MVDGGTVLPRWHPHGSRSSSSWRHFFNRGGRFEDRARSFVSSVVAYVGCCCVLMVRTGTLSFRAGGDVLC